MQKLFLVALIQAARHSQRITRINNMGRINRSAEEKLTFYFY